MTVITSRSKSEVVEHVVEKSGLSWEVIENQSREYVMAILRTIDGLNEDQCSTLYQRIDEKTSIVFGRTMSKWMRDMKKIVLWIRGGVS